MMKSKDFKALVVLVGIGILKYNGVNGTLDGVAGLILGYYFVKRIEHKDNGQ